MNMVNQHQQIESTEIYQICLKDAGLTRNAWDNYIVGCKKSKLDCNNCKKCEKCKKNCDYPLDEDVAELVERINSYLVILGSNLSQFIDYGFPKVCLGNLYELLMYKDILVKMHDGLLLEKKGFKCTNCVCPNKFPLIRSKVVSIIGNQQQEFFNEVRDESGIDEWLLKNPNCVSFDRWRRVYYKLVHDFRITVTPVVEKQCSFVYSAVIQKELKCDIIVSALKEADKNCEIGVSSKIDQDKCSQQYIAIKKDSNCGISYKAFEAAISCGFTAKSIAKLYGCGAKIKATKTKNNCIISLGSKEEIVCNKDNFKSIIKQISCATS
jgi:hypothetical protein